MLGHLEQGLGHPFYVTKDRLDFHNVDVEKMELIGRRLFNNETQNQRRKEFAKS